MDEQNLIKIINRIEKLEKAVFGDKKEKRYKKNAETFNDEGADFSLNIRAFVKRYAANKSGPKKFTLSVAYFAKGEIGKDIKLKTIRQAWNKMAAKALLGGKFNMFYPNDAKTRGWVDSKNHGSYCLTKEWKNIFKS